MGGDMCPEGAAGDPLRSELTTGRHLHAWGYIHPVEVA